METIKLILSFIGGGVLLEILKLTYPDLKKVFRRRIEAKNIFNKHSELILKSADELFGKMYSLAKEDFRIFTHYNSQTDEMNKIYILYLFGSFWASLGILKQESSFVNLARIKKGKRLLMFVTSYESKKNRILERSYQRAIGESVISRESNELKIMSLYDFTNEYKKSNSDIYKIVQPLEASLFQTGIKEHRQKFLLFGIIIHSLIDFLDKNHSVARDRKPYINKLSQNTKSQLELRIFNHYLPFVKDAKKYYKR
ncbi:hypothetical protein [uncultured Draconibacterium sp.]|uniref:hypothetical protein n=1 Tax=uncultured Draconibacterium sp. TaxID=1573823 RepID=UPI003261AADB